jgi:hypothetical protein
VNSVPVGPNDKISAEVSATSKGTFTVTIKNVSTGAKFQTSAKMNNADRSSAEWIAEAPWSGGVLPLANFGTAQFGPSYTAVDGTGSATVNGITKDIGLLANNIQIDMVDKSGAVKADTSDLSNGNSFTILRKSAGP